MKFNYKSRKGFTLIELLVVIGILAVLAAIAIPSVAGLIDRANVSADKTNSNEMTNAVERFVSEYELYKQDVASGVLDTSNLDSAQGRVFNVTGITTRANIEKFESTGLSGKGVNIDTKYPANEETVKAVIQNYTKTSSSTFEPKQSDCQFYYSPEVGAVIVGKTGATVSELNNIYFSGSDDANADGTVQWICLDETVDNVATDTPNTSDTLDNNIQKPVIKSMKISSSFHASATSVTINYEEGMTWSEWFDSEYNDGSLGLTTVTNDINKTYYTQNNECSKSNCNCYRTTSGGIKGELLLLGVREIFETKNNEGSEGKIYPVSSNSKIDDPFSSGERDNCTKYLGYAFICYDEQKDWISTPIA